MAITSFLIWLMVPPGRLCPIQGLHNPGFRRVFVFALPVSRNYFLLTWKGRCGTVSKVSMDRQIKMIDMGARSMQDKLFMQRDDALEVITKALASELEERNTRLDSVLRSSKAEQTVFLRGVVSKVEQLLRKRTEFDEDMVKRGIQDVMRVWHDSWAL